MSAFIWSGAYSVWGNVQLAVVEGCEKLSFYSKSS